MMKPARSQFETVFFDLDGTLIDNFAAIYRCYADVAREMQLVPKSYEQLRATVGGALHMTLSRLIGDDLAPEGVRRFRKHFPDVMFENVFVFDGVEWILQALKKRGHKLAVFTNKHFSATEALLDFLKLRNYFDGVFGTEMPAMPWRKPEREYTKYALKKMNTRAENTLLIGDSPFDIQAANAIGMPFACVTTGTHVPAALIAASNAPEMIFPNMFALGKKIFNLTPP